jgi:hypothetical protein
MIAQRVNITSLFPVSLERARSAVSAVRSQVNAKLNAVPAPELIFHYTNDIGLHGVLTSGKIWLTDVAHLNDPSELQYGIEVAFEELKTATSNRVELLKDFAIEFEEVLKSIATSISRNFVCCFSTSGNELSQWRAYADNAKGYAIGFSGDELEQAFSKGSDGNGRQTFPMSYREIEIREIHKEIINLVLSEALKPLKLPALGFEDQYLSFLREIAGTLASSILLHSTRFKHPAYESEHEYRFHEILLDQANPSSIQHRVRRNSLVPYREFDWRQLAPHSLKKIMVGPAADEKQAVSFAKECLHIHGYKNIDIEVSKIPYRAV